jgi:hypothetical protein
MSEESVKKSDAGMAILKEVAAALGDIAEASEALNAQAEPMHGMVQELSARVAGRQGRFRPRPIHPLRQNIASIVRPMAAMIDSAAG